LIDTLKEKVIKKIFLPVFLATVVLFMFSAAPVRPDTQIKRAFRQLSVGAYIIQAEIAATDTEFRRGLMMRSELGANDGMLFDYNIPMIICMWMKNTLIPLSVAFIDTDGIIVNIKDMRPRTLREHCSRKPVRYALEMNRGWFDERNIRPGDRIKGLPGHH
jgi:uncharacterized protein